MEVIESLHLLCWKRKKQSLFQVLTSIFPLFDPPLIIKSINDLLGSQFVIGMTFTCKLLHNMIILNGTNVTPEFHKLITNLRKELEKDDIMLGKNENGDIILWIKRINVNGTIYQKSKSIIRKYIEINDGELSIWDIQLPNSVAHSEDFSFSISNDITKKIVKEIKEIKE